MKSNDVSEIQVAIEKMLKAEPYLIEFTTHDGYKFKNFRFKMGESYYNENPILTACVDSLSLYLTVMTLHKQKSIFEGK